MKILAENVHLFEKKEIDNSFFDIIYEILKNHKNFNSKYRTTKENIEKVENFSEEELTEDPKVAKKYDYLKKQIEGCSQPNLKQKGISWALKPDAEPRMDSPFMYIDEDFIKTPYTFTAQEALDAWVENKDIHRPNDRKDVEANLEYDKNEAEMEFIGGKMDRLASAYANLIEEYNKAQRAKERVENKRKKQEAIDHTMCEPIQEMEDFGKDVMIDKYIEVMTNMYKREYNRYISDKENGRYRYYCDYRCTEKVWEESGYDTRIRKEAEIYVRNELDRAYFEIGTFAGHSPKLINVNTDFRQNITALVEQTEDTKYGTIGQKWYVRTILAWGPINKPHFRTIINKR